MSDEELALGHKPAWGAGRQREGAGRRSPTWQALPPGPDQAGGKSTPGPFVFSLLLTDIDWAAFLLLHLKGLWD